MPRGDLIQYRRGTAAAWALANPILVAGEIGYVTDANEIRVGNGSDTWSNLEPIGSVSEEHIGEAVASYLVANPITKTTVGLGNVDNTSDANKPVSIAAQTALDGKQAAGSYAATSHTHAQTDVTGLTSALAGKAASTHSHAQSDVTNLATDLAAKAPLASPAFTGTPTGITKAHVGLGSVDNTSDAGKPVSTAQQAALDGKAAAAHTHAQSDVTGLTTALAGKAAASHSHAISDITASGTASSTTYLRGDGTWQTPAGGGAVSSVNTKTGAVTLNQDEIADGTTYKQYSATDKTKLAGVAAGATANSSDATLLARANHTGTQAQSTVTNLTTDLAGKAASSHTHAQSEVTNLTTDLAAKAPLASPAFTGTPTGITKSHVGLGNVDNTADSAKPVSTAQQTALDGKAASSHTHSQSDVTGLTSALAGKAATTHSHAVGDITATGTASSSTYLRGDGSWSTPAAGGGGITAEDAMDAVAAMIAVTGNASKNYNDAADTLTLDVPQGIPAVSSEPAGPVGLVWVKDLGAGAYSLQIKTS